MFEVAVPNVVAFVKPVRSPSASSGLVASGRMVVLKAICFSLAAHIEALSLATGRRQVLVDPGTFPLYAPSGHLIFFRDDALLATGDSTSVCRVQRVPSCGGGVSARAEKLAPRRCWICSSRRTKLPGE